MIKIDYIIPAYNESCVVSRALDALSKQTMKDNLCITIVNDCSPYTNCNYQDLVYKYKGNLDIRVIKTPDNLGAGMARQYGIDNTTNPYIMFQDADDVLNDECTIEDFVKTLNSSDSLVKSIVCGWVETDSNGSIIGKRDSKHMNTCVARLIFRDMLKEYNIRFDDDMSRLFEDRDFYIKYIYILKSRGYKEIYIDKHYYVYMRGNKLSTMNNTSLEKTDVYHAILEFKKYEFMKEHEADEDILWDILNYAFEKAFFSVVRVAKNPKIEINDILLLRTLIEKHYYELGGYYELHDNSIIYNIKGIENIEIKYEYFLSSPYETIDKIIKNISKNI